MADRYGLIDLGGTKILTAVATDDGAWLAYDRRPTEADLGRDEVVAHIIASLRASISSAGGTPVKAIGIGAAGPIDFERGVIVSAPNLIGWKDVPLGALISMALGCPAVLENDANAAALGEWTYGAGRGARNMVYVTISTGIGGGLILDGRLYRGATGGAGELGHTLIDEHGPRCGCGARGCVEAMASGPAIATMAEELVRNGGSSVLSEAAAHGALTSEAVARAAAEGDEGAHRVIVRAGHYLGLAMTVWANLFDPDVIVVGGGVSQIGATLLDPAVKVLRSRAIGTVAKHVRIVPGELGDKAVCAGVLALARQA